MATTYRATMIRKVITSKTYKVTKIVYEITPEGLDMLEESIGEILTKHKAYHFHQRNVFCTHSDYIDRKQVPGCNQ